MIITNKQNRKKLLISLLVTCVLIINFCYLVSALGLSTIYTDNYPFEIGPGETKDIEISLSSLEATKAKVNLTSGNEIATIMDESDEYDVENSANINMQIKIPAGVAEGTEYTVRLSAKTITPPGGMISTVGETGISFKVLVKTSTPEETPAAEGISLIWWILGIIVVIAIIAIIWFVVKSRKE
ncbi:MAG: hypothetical protein Q8N63_05675 [Nanoarchaeota archaeon]|nr:hypothetical protein [Nanoarchaeota archaeon]